jgi:stage II sporulation protein M
MNVITSKKIELLPSIFVVLAVFAAFIFLGTRLPKEVSDASLAQLTEVVSWMKAAGPVASLLSLFLMNTLECFIIIMTGLIIGLPPVISISINASMLGILIANSPDVGPAVLLAGILPHGIIEIPAFLFSAALGIAVGRQVFKFLMREESSARIHLAYALNFFYKWIIPALLLASIIEVFITPGIVLTAGGNGSSMILP